MTIAEIQQEILRMKKEQDVCILAHAYQGQEILEVADYMGDSYGLSVQASKSKCSGVIMCGVRFMAETCIRTIRLWRISIQHQNSRQNVMYA